MATSYLPVAPTTRRRHTGVAAVSLLLLSSSVPYTHAGKDGWAQSAKDAARAGALETIAHLLSDNTVVIFSLSKGCSACRRVKSYFEDEGIPYYALELDQRSDGDALKAALAERTGSSKTPTVYIRGHLVGGTSDVSRAYKSGELSHWTDDPDAVAPPEDETCDAPLVSHEV